MKSVVIFVWNCFVIPVGLVISLLTKIFELLAAGGERICDWLLIIDTDLYCWSGKFEQWRKQAQRNWINKRNSK